MLLAAFGCRRPTRDIDLLMREMNSDKDNVLMYVRQIASTAQNDGLPFDAEHATAKVI